MTLLLLGSRYYANSFAKTFEQLGASSLGLRITELPAAMAAATKGKEQ